MVDEGGNDFVPNGPEVEQAGPTPKPEEVAGHLEPYLTGMTVEIDRLEMTQ